MANQSERERCFETYVVIFTYIFRCSDQRHTVLTLLLRSFAEKKNVSVAAF